MASSAPLPPLESDWVCLSRDVLFDVFLRLGHRDLLRGAGLACAAWWRLARHEPLLWRRIDLTAPDDKGRKETARATFKRSASQRDASCGRGDDVVFFVPDWLFDEDAVASEGCSNDTIVTMGWKEMARAAVERSAGQCEGFCGRGDDDVFRYLADRAPSLKSLFITSHYDVSSKVFVELITKFPLLEEHELVLKFDDSKDTFKRIEPSNNCWAEVLQAACKACRHLNQFTVRHAGSMVGPVRHYHQRASTFVQEFAIRTMRGLRSLRLSGNSFTRDVVLSIIDGCPNLQSLDISDVHCLSPMDEELRDKFSRINDLIPPWLSFMYEESYFEESDDDDSLGEGDFDFEFNCYNMGSYYDSDEGSHDSDSDEGECYFGNLFADELKGNEHPLCDN